MQRGPDLAMARDRRFESTSSSGESGTNSIIGLKRGASDGPTSCRNLFTMKSNQPFLPSIMPTQSNCHGSMRGSWKRSYWLTK